IFVILTTRFFYQYSLQLFFKSKK
ncbi:MAG: hypothetical protein E6651_14740, partial [Acinetobacter sp.]